MSFNDYDTNKYIIEKLKTFTSSKLVSTIFSERQKNILAKYDGCWMNILSIDTYS